MSEFTITYGKQTFDTSSDSVTAFSLPLVRGTKWRDKKAITAIYSRLSGNATMASTDGHEAHGKWFTSTYFAPTRTLDNAHPLAAVVLTLNRRVRSVTTASCCLHIVPEPSGPHLIVRAKLSPNRLSAMGTQVGIFRGRGYIMDHEQLALLGVTIEPRDKHLYMDAEEIEDEFEIETVQGSAPAAPEIMTVGSGDDAKVIVVPPRPTRRIRVR